MKKQILFFIVLSTACVMGVKGQSIVKPLAPQLYLKSAGHLKLSIDTTITGNSWSGFRLTGVTVLYAYDFSTQSSTIFTGTGIDYEHDVLQATGRYYTQWAVAIGVYEGGQFAPTSVSMVTGIGIHLALFNKYVLLGALYNFTNKTLLPAIGGNANIIPTN